MDTIEKFFSKKRELSSKSNDGDAPKKLREDQANLSATSDVLLVMRMFLKED